MSPDTQAAVLLWTVAGAIALAGVVRWVRTLDQRIDAMVAEGLAATAADFGEPTRETVERLMGDDEWATENGRTRAGAERMFAAIGELDEKTEDWIFPDPAFYQQMRHEDDVRFVGAVLADIDELTGGDAA